MDTEKIKLCFLFDGQGRTGIDLSRPDKGNPGVGGTQFCFLLVAFYLLRYFPDKYDITFISQEALRLPDGIANIVVKELSGIRDVVPRNSILVIKQSNSEDYYRCIDDLREVKVIHWVHNYLYSDIARRVAKQPNIKANVFVGRQFYDFYIDHDIIKKSVAIFNIVPFVEAPARKMPEVPSICFMGQISRAKGIITLLKVWRKVRESVPGCRLRIIGGGNLYDRNVRLGSLGVTDDGTESEMMKYIAGPDGSVSPDVEFLGILGKEKYDVFANSTVGMVNPSARTETFGMGIIEMASAALPVVTRNWNGHPDTAINGETALLAFTVNGMAKAVVRLIKDKELNVRLGENAKERARMFLPEAIIPEWDRLLTEVNDGTFAPKRSRLTRPYRNNYKFIRGANAFVRQDMGLKFLPAVVDAESMGMKMLKKLLS